MLNQKEEADAGRQPCEQPTEEAHGLQSPDSTLGVPQRQAPPPAGESLTSALLPGESDEAQSKQAQLSKDLDLVTSLGLVFQNTTLYGPEHRISASVTDACFASVLAFLEGMKQIELATCDNLPVVNGRPVRKSSGLTSHFVQQLQERDIGCFSITLGISREEFGALMEVLTAKPQELLALGGFTATIGALAFGNVIGTAAAYKRVEGEEQQGDGSGASSGNGAQGAEKPEEGTDELASILSFLTGQSETPGPQTGSELMRVAANPQQLASIITQATETTHASIQFQDGKTLAAVAADCLRRTFAALSTTKTAKSLKGRKTLTKALSRIEKHVLEWIAKRTGEEASASDVSVLSETVTDIRDELEIETLVQDYVRKRSAADTNEKRIVRYMRTKGADALRDVGLGDRLMEEGLAVGGWQELLVKSRVYDGRDSGLSAVDHFSVLLTTLESADDSSGEVAKVLDGVNNELEKLAVRAERKILQLMEEIDNPTEDAPKDAPGVGRSPQLSRRKLVEILAEVIQELCQPLTVVKCVIGTLRSKRLGDLTEHQTDLLKTAAESSDRLEHMVTRLTEVCGVPESLSPDADIQRLIRE